MESKPEYDQEQQTMSSSISNQTVAPNTTNSKHNKNYKNHKKYVKTRNAITENHNHKPNSASSKNKTNRYKKNFIRKYVPE